MDSTAAQPAMRAAAITKVRDQKGGLTFFDALALAGSIGKRLARNSEFDAYFSTVPSEGPMTLSHNAWTSTIAAYPKPRKAFGDSVEWADPATGTRYRVDTSMFKGEKGMAIAFEEFEAVRDGGTVLYVPKSAIAVIAPFPQESGFYAFSPGSLLPFDDGAEHGPFSPATRHLSRDNNREWAGPVVRSYSRIRHPDNLDNDLYLHFRPTLNLGVFVADKS